jgi:hypothetical protein
MLQENVTLLESPVQAFYARDLEKTDPVRSAS